MVDDVVERVLQCDHLVRKGRVPLANMLGCVDKGVEVHAPVYVCAAVEAQVLELFFRHGVFLDGGGGCWMWP